MEKLLSTQQVADYLGIHVKTLLKQLRENKIALAFIQLAPRQIAFRPSEVERYISTHEIVRDGKGLKKRVQKKLKSVLIMTDEEAQVFFEGVERDPDGVLLDSQK